MRRPPTVLRVDSERLTLTDQETRASQHRDRFYAEAPALGIEPGAWPTEIRVAWGHGRSTEVFALARVRVDGGAEYHARRATTRTAFLFLSPDAGGSIR